MDRGNHIIWKDRSCRMTTHKVENKNIESTARKLICLKVLLWDTVKIGIIVGHQILVNYS